MSSVRWVPFANSGTQNPTYQMRDKHTCVLVIGSTRAGGIDPVKEIRGLERVHREFESENEKRSSSHEKVPHRQLFQT
jgi:glutamate/tyrosine decarboxylase-like PLP-dependent enzyme